LFVTVTDEVLAAYSWGTSVVHRHKWISHTSLVFPCRSLGTVASDFTTSAGV